jgi:hypothetical protein
LKRVSWVSRPGWGDAGDAGDAYSQKGVNADSAIGSLVPTCADEAKTLIPSLVGQISDQDLDDLCNDLQKLKRQAQL